MRCPGSTNSSKLVARKKNHSRSLRFPAVGTPKITGISLRPPCLARSSSLEFLTTPQDESALEIPSSFPPPLRLPTELRRVETSDRKATRSADRKFNRFRATNIRRFSPPVASERNDFPRKPAETRQRDWTFHERLHARGSP